MSSLWIEHYIRIPGLRLQQTDSQEEKLKWPSFASTAAHEQSNPRPDRKVYSSMSSIWRPANGPQRLPGNFGLRGLGPGTGDGAGGEGPGLGASEVEDVQFPLDPIFAPVLKSWQLSSFFCHVAHWGMVEQRWQHDAASVHFDFFNVLDPPR